MCGHRTSWTRKNDEGFSQQVHKIEIGVQSVQTVVGEGVFSENTCMGGP